MLSKASPRGTDSDEDIERAVGASLKEDKGEFGQLTAEALASKGGYEKGDWVYIIKDDIKYYFVCRQANGSNSQSDPAIPPPNSTYWVADECSKSLTGCRMRWGAGLSKNKGAVPSDTSVLNKGTLPYGGFPAAKKMSRLG